MEASFAIEVTLKSGASVEIQGLTKVELGRKLDGNLAALHVTHTNGVAREYLYVSPNEVAAIVVLNDEIIGGAA